MTPIDKTKSGVSLSIIVPAYNEEALIEETVEHLLETGRRWVGDLEIIVVNDGSSDQTPGIIDRLANEHETVRSFHQTPNKGFGATVRMGLENATKDIVTFCPADHHFSDKEFEIYLTLIKHSDIVLGYRRERRSNQKLYSWMLSHFYHVLVNALFRQDLYDVNWIQMYHRNQLPLFMGTSDGVFFLAETIIRAKRRELNVVGVDVSYVERTIGDATGGKFQTIFNTVREMLAFFLKQGRP
jgi:glycosyltransferase involved in cell wall biosynthesis